MISIISTMEPIAQDTHFVKIFEHPKRQKYPTDLVQICKFFLMHLSCWIPSSYGQVATDYMYIVRESGDEVSGRGDSAGLFSVDGLMIFCGACISVCCKKTANWCMLWFQSIQLFAKSHLQIWPHREQGQGGQISLFFWKCHTIFFEFIRLFVHNSACRKHWLNLKLCAFVQCCR